MILPFISLFLLFAVFIVFIIGMVKPSSIMKWSKNPTRLKVFGLWIISSIGLWILTIVGITTSEDFTNSGIETAENFIKEEKYEYVEPALKNIKPEDSLYVKAQSLIKQADSLKIVKQENERIANEKAEEEKKIALELAEKKERESKTESQIEQLKRELESVNKGVDFSTYRGTVDALQLELILFGTWANLVKESEEFENSEILKLSKSLKSKVANIQAREFPILRKEYTKVVANKMWENDIEVYSNGSGNKYINFSGGIFAANKNKQDFHNQLNEILTMFRFKQARYRWYKGADKYTYWTMYEGKDSEPVTFGN